MIKNQINLYFLLLVLSLGSISTPVWSETIIAIFDSGVDPDHKDLERKLKKNNKEELNGQDDDQNEAVDDLYGWNLIDENKKIFKHELRGTFPADIYKYYKVKTKKTLGTITERELAWYSEIRKDEDFMKTLKIFKSFIHGTHIAGIAVNTEGALSYLDIKYYPIRYLGTTESGRWIEPKYSPLKQGQHQTRVNHIKKFFTKYTNWQKEKWIRAIQLTHKKTEIINGSFGKSFKSVLKVATDIYFSEFEKEVPDDLKEELARDFLSKLNILTEQIANKYLNTYLFFQLGIRKQIMMSNYITLPMLVLII